MLPSRFHQNYSKSDISKRKTFLQIILGFKLKIIRNKNEEISVVKTHFWTKKHQKQVRLPF